MKLHIWQDPRYYEEARLASEAAHPSLTFLRNRFTGKSILEVGCGEGTKLQSLSAKKKTGVDISPVAIKLAKKKLDEARVADVNKLPYVRGSFDAVLSFFSLEHFNNPELAIKEMQRVLKKNGELVIVTPNFGAPNRSSPCFAGSRIAKLITGFWYDLFPKQSNTLNFHHVEPLSGKMSYLSDYDTLVEPYANSLFRYLSRQGFHIVLKTTMWEIENLQKLSIIQRLFYYLSQLRIYPFTYWGPHIFVIAQKL